MTAAINSSRQQSRTVYKNQGSLETGKNIISRYGRNAGTQLSRNTILLTDTLAQQDARQKPENVIILLQGIRLLLENDLNLEADQRCRWNIMKQVDVLYVNVNDPKQDSEVIQQFDPKVYESLIAELKRSPKASAFKDAILIMEEAFAQKRIMTAEEVALIHATIGEDIIIDEKCMEKTIEKLESLGYMKKCSGKALIGKGKAQSFINVANRVGEATDSKLTQEEMAKNQLITLILSEMAANQNDNRTPILKGLSGFAAFIMSDEENLPKMVVGKRGQICPERVNVVKVEEFENLIGKIKESARGEEEREAIEKINQIMKDKEFAAIDVHQIYTQLIPHCQINKEELKALLDRLQDNGWITEEDKRILQATSGNDCQMDQFTKDLFPRVATDGKGKLIKKPKKKTAKKPSLGYSILPESDQEMQNPEQAYRNWLQSQPPMTQDGFNKRFSGPSYQQPENQLPVTPYQNLQKSANNPKESEKKKDSETKKKDSDPKKK